MLSILDERPLDPNAWRIIQALKLVADAEDVSYMIIGAMARDILMSHVFDRESGRRTRDVDFAVAIDNWSVFEKMKQALVSTGDFSADKKKAHRLYFRRSQLDHGYPLDLIPFGGLESPQHQIAWPPDMQVLMNVTGYVEALKAALLVDLGNGLIATVISIPSLVLLKLFAWDGRGLQISSDAQDVYFLLKNYSAIDVDRLYDTEFSLLSACGHDAMLAGAMLLGADTRRLFSHSHIEQLIALLALEKKRNRLELQMDRNNVEAARALINSFEAGLRSES